jgi:hypothetical protein
VAQVQDLGLAQLAAVTAPQQSGKDGISHCLSFSSGLAPGALVVPLGRPH